MNREISEILTTLEEQSELIKKYTSDLDANCTAVDDNSMRVTDYSIEEVDSVNLEAGELTTDGKLVVHSFEIERKESVYGLYLFEKEEYDEVIEVFSNCSRDIRQAVDDLDGCSERVLSSEEDMERGLSGNYSLNPDEVALMRSVRRLVRNGEQPVVLSSTGHVALLRGANSSRKILLALKDLLKDSES